MKWYRNFLYKTCNPTSGQWWWSIIMMAGIAGMATYVIVAAPFCAAWLNFSYLGAFSKGEFILFNGMFHLSSKAFSLYFLSILFVIPLVKLSYLVFMVGMNYAGGLIFLPPQVSRHPTGFWIKK